MKELEDLTSKLQSLGLHRQIHILNYEVLQTFVLEKIIDENNNKNNELYLFYFADLPYSSKNSDIINAVNPIYMFLDEKTKKLKVKFFNFERKIKSNLNTNSLDGITIRNLKIDGTPIQEFIIKELFSSNKINLKIYDVSNLMRDMFRILEKYRYIPTSIYLIDEKTGKSYLVNSIEKIIESIKEKNNWRPLSKDYYPLYVLGHCGESRGIMLAKYLFENFDIVDENFIREKMGFIRYCSFDRELPIIRINYPLAEEITKYSDIIKKIGGNPKNFYRISFSPIVFEEIVEKAINEIEKIGKSREDLKINEVQRTIAEITLKYLNEHL
ncbi:MAG: hypothetical protein QXL82_00260 [Candidatus Aenigmatarchaeota archaeon]